jgi:ABC-2 type transport system permease protein
MRLLRNATRQVLLQRPVRLVGTALSALLLWAGLFILLVQTFRLVRRPVLEGIVATPLIFTFFFLALTAMLAFSTAILAYGSLFRRPESVYLVASPVPARDLVVMRYLESLVLASWSLVLFGVPLMLAMGYVFDEPWWFFPIFIGLFVLFIPIPGAIGLMLAWLMALFFPKTPRRMIIMVAMLLAAFGVWWVWDIVTTPISASDWLQNFYDRVSLAQSALLPHTWVAKGIVNAIQGQLADAAFYLFVTAANALFASVVVVGIVSRGFGSAFTRAQVSSTRKLQRSSRWLSLLAEIVFAYLPRKQRLLAIKDLKNFIRDPLQWSQMAILIGLLALYLGNVQQLWTELAVTKLRVLIAFLNLTAVCLILATFTSRFVFPIVSLEGQQLWLLGLLPLSRTRMIIAKFLFALTLTLVAALSVMGISIYRLQLPGPLAVSHLVAAAAVCLGLAGVSIGMGARLPMLNEHNPARIAGGFGGTVSLLMSVALVIASLVGMGMMSLQVTEGGSAQAWTATMIIWLAAVAAGNGIAAAVAMTVGIRHFERMEC